jgi:hypothetical protein
MVNAQSHPGIECSAIEATIHARKVVALVRAAVTSKRVFANSEDMDSLHDGVSFRA